MQTTTENTENTEEIREVENEGHLMKSFRFLCKLGLLSPSVFSVFSVVINLG